MVQQKFQAVNAFFVPPIFATGQRAKLPCPENDAVVIFDDGNSSRHRGVP
jgi:hypothetical protein